MKVRTRDFIYTTDGMYFASTNYIHPEDRYISFLRYIPDENGDREKDGIRYRKVGSEEAYSYLRENYPDYLYFTIWLLKYYLYNNIREIYISLIKLTKF